MKHVKRIAQPMRMSVMLVAVMACGCRPATTALPQELSEAPFRDIRDVQLGIDTQTLARMRHVQPAGMNEYHENIRGYVVAYRVDEKGKVTSISVPEADASGAAALVRYEQYQQQAFRSLGVKPVCRYSQSTRTMMAEYQLQDAILEVVYMASDGTPGALSVVTRTFGRAPAPQWQTGSPQRCML